MDLIKRVKNHKTLTVIALIHWAISFVTDRIFFDYVYFDTSSVTGIVKSLITWSAKAVFLVVLIALYQGAYAFFKEADKDYRKYVLIYFIFNIFMLILTWPGIFRMDEFGVLFSASKLFPVFWQNYLTSVFYILSLMLIPVPSGVIIIQMLCISLLAGDIVRMCVKRFGLLGLISFVPFFMFPVLDSNLYPMRMSLYAFIELWVLARLFFKEKTPAFLLGFMAALVAVWRTEAIYYFIIFPAAFLLFGKQNIEDKNCENTKRSSECFKLVTAFLVIALPLYLIQAVGERMTSSRQYDLTSVVLPLVPLVNAEYENVYGATASEDEIDLSSSAELSDIDKVVGIRDIRKAYAEGKNGINIFWGGLYADTDYTDEEYSAFKSAFYRLALRYPGVFLSERMNCFLNSTELLQNTTEIFDELDEPVQNYEDLKACFGTSPILGGGIRKCVIKFIELRRMSDYFEKKPGYGFVYGVIFPLAVLLCTLVYLLIKGEWYRALLNAAVLLRVPLVFLTAPSSLFMYYYSVYLVGWSVFFFILISTVSSQDEKRGGYINKTLLYAKRNGIGPAIEEIKERFNKMETDELTKRAAGYVGDRDWGDPENKNIDLTDKNETDKLNNMPYLTVVIPAFKPDPGFFKELLQSLADQIYDNFEIVISDGGAAEGNGLKNTINEFLEESDSGKKIKSRLNYLPLESNKGISENTNAGIREAKGDYITLVDHDDILTKDALFETAKEIAKSKNKRIFVYSDEDKCNREGTSFFEPNFKPDFDKELLLSNNYICHLLTVRSDVLKEVMLRSEFDGAQDYDLVLRLTEVAEMKNPDNCDTISHIPFVLYHWRTHEGSTAANTASKTYAYEAGLNALKEYYIRKGLSDKVRVSHSRHLGFYDTEYIPDIFSVRKDVGGIAGRVIKDKKVTGGPKRFVGMDENAGGYLHRARFYSEVTLDDVDERALKLRDDIKDLSELKEKGLKIVYDPGFKVYE